LLDAVDRVAIGPAAERLALHFARSGPSAPEPGARKRSNWMLRAVTGAALLLLAFAVVKMTLVTARLSRSAMLGILAGAGATFLRVEATLLLAALWTVPAGVAVGLRPRLAAILQPLAQIAASVPATALFPIVLLFLIRAGGGLGTGSIVLLLLGTQWYILFNVIAGASAIPTDLKEACRVFGIRGVERWRKLFLPAIFPYLITGFVTASGGAWNASIVAEYFKFRGQTLSTVGLGAVISRATDNGDVPALLGATLVMAAMVVIFNRLVWRRLYVLASTRFRMEM
jgi:NitT/TauT family transport system permease protein